MLSVKTDRFLFTYNVYCPHFEEEKKEHNIFLDMFTTLSLISILLAYNVDEKFNNMKNVSPSVMHSIMLIFNILTFDMKINSHNDKTRGLPTCTCIEFMHD